VSAPTGGYPSNLLQPTLERPRPKVQGFEARGSDPKRSTLIAWRNALAKAGVEFTDETDEHGPGVRLRKRR
jgi:hypothetical protein